MRNLLALSLLLIPLAIVSAEGTPDGSTPTTEPPLVKQEPLVEPSSEPLPAEPEPGVTLPAPRPDDPVSSPAAGGGAAAQPPGSTLAPAGEVEPVVSETDAEPIPTTSDGTSLPLALWVAMVFVVVFPAFGFLIAQFAKKKEPEEEKHNCSDIKKRLEKKLEEFTDMRAALNAKAEGAVRHAARSALKNTAAKASMEALEALEREVGTLQKLLTECELGYTASMKQTITPFLWFNDQCDEAMTFYTSLFPNSKIVSVKRYPTDMQLGPTPHMGGKVLTGVFELDGYQFMALDGGPHFSFTPTQSISVQCKDVAEIDMLHAKLREGGTDLMPLDVYPWSKKYAWINDQYGLSWQLNVPHDYGTVTHRFAETKMFHGAFNGKAEEAITFYTSVFPHSAIDAVFRHDENAPVGTPGTVSHADYTLMNQAFMALDGGTVHAFGTSGALSLLVECKDQEEIDRYWNALSSDPAFEQCGWCKDKYGFSWQIVPDMSRWLGDESEGSKRALHAMLEMKKIDVAKLQQAYDGA